jgi:hypothetical protein
VKTTRVSTLIMLVVIGGVVMWSVQVVATRVGYPSFMAPPTMGLALGMGGLLLLGLAWPIRQFQKKAPGARRVDPVYATRVVLLAKAASLTAAAFIGGGIGAGVFVATRPVVSSEAVTLTVVWLVGAIVLMVGSVIAERWCTVRLSADDPDEMPEEGEIA